MRSTRRKKYSYNDYPKDVLDGAIVVGELVKRACERWNDFQQDDRFYFAKKEVEKVIDFISSLEHYTGKHNGKPFLLEPWQQFAIANIFGWYWVESETRVTKSVYIQIARKNGKALALDTPIPTPQGWSTMGDIKVGDYVIGRNGAATRVINATSVQYNRECYEVVFEDGETIVADADHNWCVLVDGVDKIVTTGAALNYYYRTGTHYEIPLSDDIAFNSIGANGKLTKSITSITKVDSVPVKCIEVDAADHLFLCGKNNTVTHNSAFAAALTLYCLLLDGEPDSEVLFVANTKEQARLAFKMARKFCTQIDPLGNDIICLKNTIDVDAISASLKVLSSDLRGLDGYNAHVYLQDELHAAKDGELTQVLQSSQGMRENPLGIHITTAGYTIGGYCHGMRATCVDILNRTKVDDTQFSLIYEMDEGDDWTDPSVWIKSNPNLGITVREQYLKEQVQKAKNSRAEEVGVKTKNLNMWMSSSTVWIPQSTISMQNAVVELAKYQGQECYIGVDLASTSDLTAVSFLIPTEEKMVFKTLYFLPEDSISDLSISDHRQWQQEGHLIVTPGNVTDYDYITNILMDVSQYLYIESIRYDAYNATQWAVQCTELGLPVKPYSQSIGAFNKPTKEMERILLSNKCIIDDNPITTMCFENIELKHDHNQNCKPVKRISTKKIDGVIAMIMALAGYLERDYQGGGTVTTM